MARTGSILIVDPENTIADLLAEVLTDEGYTVRSASDGPSAFQLSMSQAPTLLMVEQRLPGATASALIAQLRGAGLTSMPVVVMTTDSATAARLGVPSVSAYLQKPFDIDELLTCVARYVLPTCALVTAAHATLN